MKKYFLYIEFFLLSLFFVLPPFFVNNNTNSNLTIEKFQFSFYTIIILIVASFLYYQFEYSNYKTKKITLLNFSLILGKIFFYFGILILIYITLISISILLKLPINTNSYLNPSLKNILLILVNFIFSAFYEESLYRLYLPTILTNFFSKKLSFFNKYCPNSSMFLIETICIFIFGFSHFYLGLLGILNALISGTILRICAKKNNTIIIGTFSHFLYNTFILVLAYST